MVDLWDEGELDFGSGAFNYGGGATGIRPTGNGSALDRVLRGSGAYQPVMVPDRNRPRGYAASPLYEPAEHLEWRRPTVELPPQSPMPGEMLTRKPLPLVGAGGSRTAAARETYTPPGFPTKVQISPFGDALTQAQESAAGPFLGLAPGEEKGGFVEGPFGVPIATAPITIANAATWGREGLLALGSSLLAGTGRYEQSAGALFGEQVEGPADEDKNPLDYFIDGANAIGDAIWGPFEQFMGWFRDSNAKNRAVQVRQIITTGVAGGLIGENARAPIDFFFGADRDSALKIAEKATREGQSWDDMAAKLYDLDPAIVAAIAAKPTMSDEELEELVRGQPLSTDPFVNLALELGVQLGTLVAGGIVVRGALVAARAPMMASQAASIFTKALSGFEKLWRVNSAMTLSGWGVRGGEWALKQVAGVSGNQGVVDYMDRLLWEMPLSTNPGLNLVDGFTTMYGVHLGQLARGRVVSGSGQGRVGVDIPRLVRGEGRRAIIAGEEAIPELVVAGERVAMGKSTLRSLAKFKDVTLRDIQRTVFQPLGWTDEMTNALFGDRPINAGGDMPPFSRGDALNVLLYHALSEVRARAGDDAKILNPADGIVELSKAWVDEHIGDAVDLLAKTMIGRGDDAAWLRTRLQETYWNRAGDDGSELGMIPMYGPFDATVALLQMRNWLWVSKETAKAAADARNQIRPDWTVALDPTVDAPRVKAVKDFLAGVDPDAKLTAYQLNRIRLALPAIAAHPRLNPGRRKGWAPKVTRKEVEAILDGMVGEQQRASLEAIREAPGARPPLEVANINDDAAVGAAVGMPKDVATFVIRSLEGEEVLPAQIPDALLRWVAEHDNRPVELLMRNREGALARAQAIFEARYADAQVRGVLVEAFEDFVRTLDRITSPDKAVREALADATDAVRRPPKEEWLRRNTGPASVYEAAIREGLEFIDQELGPWLDDPVHPIRVAEVGGVPVMLPDGITGGDMAIVARIVEEARTLEGLSDAHLELLASPDTPLWQKAAIIYPLLEGEGTRWVADDVELVGKVANPAAFTEDIARVMPEVTDPTPADVLALQQRAIAHWEQLPELSARLEAVAHRIAARPGSGVANDVDDLLRRAMALGTEGELKVKSLNQKVDTRRYKYPSVEVPIETPWNHIRVHRPERVPEAVRSNESIMRSAQGRIALVDEQLGRLRRGLREEEIVWDSTPVKTAPSKPKATQAIEQLRTEYPGVAIKALEDPAKKGRWLIFMEQIRRIPGRTVQGKEAAEALAAEARAANPDGLFSVRKQYTTTKKGVTREFWVVEEIVPTRQAGATAGAPAAAPEPRVAPQNDTVPGAVESSSATPKWVKLDDGQIYETQPTPNTDGTIRVTRLQEPYLDPNDPSTFYSYDGHKITNENGPEAAAASLAEDKAYYERIVGEAESRPGSAVPGAARRRGDTFAYEGAGLELREAPEATPADVQAAYDAGNIEEGQRLQREVEAGGNEAAKASMAAAKAELAAEAARTVELEDGTVGQVVDEVAEGTVVEPPGGPPVVVERDPDTIWLGGHYRMYVGKRPAELSADDLAMSYSSVRDIVAALRERAGKSSEYPKVVKAGPKAEYAGQYRIRIDADNYADHTGKPDGGPFATSEEAAARVDAMRAEAEAQDAQRLAMAEHDLPLLEAEVARRDPDTLPVDAEGRDIPYPGTIQDAAAGYKRLRHDLRAELAGESDPYVQRRFLSNAERDLRREGEPDPSDTSKTLTGEYGRTIGRIIREERARAGLPEAEPWVLITGRRGNGETHAEFYPTREAAEAAVKADQAAEKAAAKADKEAGRKPLGNPRTYQIEESLVYKLGSEGPPAAPESERAAAYATMLDRAEEIQRRRIETGERHPDVTPEYEEFNRLEPEEIVRAKNGLAKIDAERTIRTSDPELFEAIATKGEKSASEVRKKMDRALGDGEWTPEQVVEWYTTNRSYVIEKPAYPAGGGGQVKEVHEAKRAAGREIAGEPPAEVEPAPKVTMETALANRDRVFVNPHGLAFYIDDHGNTVSLYELRNVHGGNRADYEALVKERMAATGGKKGKYTSGSLIINSQARWVASQLPEGDPLAARLEELAARYEEANAALDKKGKLGEEIESIKSTVKVHEELDAAIREAQVRLWPKQPEPQMGLFDQPAAPAAPEAPAPFAPGVRVRAGTGGRAKVGVIREVFTTDEKPPRRRAWVSFEGDAKAVARGADEDELPAGMAHDQAWDLDKLERLGDEPEAVSVGDAVWFKGRKWQVAEVREGQVGLKPSGPKGAAHAIEAGFGPDAIKTWDAAKGGWRVELPPPPQKPPEAPRFREMWATAHSEKGRAWSHKGGAMIYYQAGSPGTPPGKVTPGEWAVMPKNATSSRTFATEEEMLKFLDRKDPEAARDWRAEHKTPEQMFEELQQRKARLAELEAEPRPISFPRSDGRGTVLVTDDTRNPGKWVIAHLDENMEATGHAEYDSWAEAVEEARSFARATMEDVEEAYAASAPLSRAPEPGPVGVGVERGFPDPYDETKQIPATLRVRELGDLISDDQPGFRKELQPRDREGRITSVEQVADMAQKMTKGSDESAALMLRTESGAEGAFVVDPEGQVVAGNGRARAMREAGEPMAAAMKAALVARAAEFGIDPAVIEGMKYPVLVREVPAELAGPELAAALNVATGGMAITETAARIAKAITPEDINGLELEKVGSFAEALNSERGRAFAGGILAKLTKAEQKVYLDAKGNLNQQGVQLIQAATVAKLMRDPASSKIVAAFFETPDADVARIRSGLLGAMGQMLSAQAKIDAGIRYPQLSPGDPLARATLRIMGLREQGMGGKVLVQTLDSAEMFEDAASMFDRELARVLVELKSAPEVTAFLRAYAKAVEDSADPNQLSMFDIQPRKVDIANAAVKEINAARETALADAIAKRELASAKKGIEMGMVEPEPTKAEVIRPFTDPETGDVLISETRVDDTGITQPAVRESPAHATPEAAHDDAVRRVVEQGPERVVFDEWVGNGEMPEGVPVTIRTDDPAWAVLLQRLRAEGPDGLRAELDEYLASLGIDSYLSGFRFDAAEARLLAADAANGNPVAFIVVRGIAKATGKMPRRLAEGGTEWNLTLEDRRFPPASSFRAMLEAWDIQVRRPSDLTVVRAADEPLQTLKATEAVVVDSPPKADIPAAEYEAITGIPKDTSDASARAAEIDASPAHVVTTDADANLAASLKERSGAVPTPPDPNRPRTLEFHRPDESARIRRLEAERARWQGELTVAAQRRAALDAETYTEPDIAPFADPVVADAWARLTYIEDPFDVPGRGLERGGTPPPPPEPRALTLGEIVDHIQSIDAGAHKALGIDDNAARALRTELMDLAERALTKAGGESSPAAVARLERQRAILRKMRDHDAKVAAGKPSEPPPDVIDSPYELPAAMADLAAVLATRIERFDADTLDGYTGYQIGILPRRSKFDRSPLSPRIQYRDFTGEADALFAAAEVTIPGLGAALAEGPIKTLEKSIEDARFSRALRTFVDMAFGPRHEQQIASQTRQRLEDRIAEALENVGMADPDSIEGVHFDVTAIIKHVHEEMASFTVARLPVHRRIATIGRSALNRHAQTALELKHGKDNLPAWWEAVGGDFAELWRDSDSRTRAWLRERNPGLADAVDRVWYETRVGKQAGNLKRGLNVVYNVFRFSLDARWQALEYLEPDFLLTGRWGMGAWTDFAKLHGGVRSGFGSMGGPRDVPLPPFLSQVDRAKMREAWAWWGSQMEEIGVFARARDNAILAAMRRESPKQLEAELLRWARQDPILASTLKTFGETPEQWLERLARDWEFVDLQMGRWKDVSAGARQNVLERFGMKGEKAKTLAAKETYPGIPELEAAIAQSRGDPRVVALYERLREIQHSLYDDLASVFYGQPDRSNLQRLFNHPLLYWPISYQIKATKWLARIMFDQAFGVQLNAAPAVILQDIHDEYVRRLREDPGLVKELGSHRTLLFMAQMLLPITPFDIGVSLSPFTRFALNLGNEEVYSRNLFGVGPGYTYFNLLPRMIFEESKPGGIFAEGSPLEFAGDVGRQIQPYTIPVRRARESTLQEATVQPLAGTPVTQYEEDLPTLPKAP